MLADQPVGRSHEVVSGAAGGGVATRVATDLRIARLGKVVEMATDFTLTEDAQGELRGVKGETRLSKQVLTSEVTFAAGTATIRESAGGAEHTRSVPVKERLLGPAAIRRLVAAKLHATGDSIAYTTWSAARSAPQHVQYTAEGVETDAKGAPGPLVRVKVVADGEAGARMAWFDASGRERRTELPLPFGTMVATEVAAEPPMPGGEMTGDAFTRTLIRSNVRLPGPRELDRLVIRVELDDPALAVPSVPGDDQRIVERNERGTVIQIDRAAAPRPGAAAAGPDTIGPEYLAANAIVDPTEPSVRAIAAEVTDGVADPWQQARRLTRWVSEHMTFDAGIAFAPAAELARDRHGTCAGYAVLLASLLRAAHIPARLDLGLVYAGGIFGGHAWVEARIGGRWVPLDAALPSDGPADAARIALDRGPLDSGPGAMATAFGQVVGHAKIHIVGYAAHGRPLTQVDEAAAPYTVDGARYTNRGLGLSLTAPAGYHFTDAQAVWPDRTIVALDGADAGHVTLSEAPLPLTGDAAHPEAATLEVAAKACERATIAGRPACAIQRAGTALLAFRDGSTMFVLEARGPKARPTLDAVARTVRLSSAAR